METGRYMLIIYKTYTSHIAFMSQFTFEAFSLSLPDIGTIPDIKKLFVSVLQVIAKLRIPIVISSGVTIAFKSFVPVCRMILSGFCSTVGMT